MHFSRFPVQVHLSKHYEFRNSGASYDGIPVMASNMDTVGTFEMAKELGKVHLSCDCSKIFILLTSWLIGVWFYEIKCFLHLQSKTGLGVFVFQSSLFTAMHKHYTVEAWKDFANNNRDILQVFIICALLTILNFTTQFRY